MSPSFSLSPHGIMKHPSKPMEATMRKAAKRVSVSLTDKEINVLYSALGGYMLEGSTDDPAAGYDCNADALVEKLLLARAKVRAKA